jgi:O-antigen/teichoic acid export membrane protein
MIAAVLTGYPQVMLAAGRPRPLMIYNCVILVVYCCAVWLTAKHGLVTVAAAVVGVHVLMLTTVYLVLFRGVLGIHIGRLVTDLAPAVVGSVLVILVGEPLASALRGVGAPALVVVASVGLVGACVHLAALRSFFSPVWADLLGMGRRLLPARRPFRRPAISSSSG